MGVQGFSFLQLYEQCIEGGSSCQGRDAYVGRDAVTTLTRPATFDALFIELEKAEALDTTKPSKKAKKVARDQLASEVTNVMTSALIKEIYISYRKIVPAEICPAKQL